MSESVADMHVKKKKNMASIIASRLSREGICSMLGLKEKRQKTERERERERKKRARERERKKRARERERERTAEDSRGLKDKRQTMCLTILYCKQCRADNCNGVVMTNIQQPILCEAARQLGSSFGACGQPTTFACAFLPAGRTLRCDACIQWLRSQYV
ncbi:hypothetical protein XA68_17806 [Ophiocordyceps unilateralis]|uniref:Uncharacterized protein n=1 Tax=Ophiocordyceps unilateralis TaxID=268505 RepID=A0A2A9P3Y3_OPHUN|nr:hypothetical protein XA68_17806 [Ophiocordyceps unilateralis]